MKQENPYGNSDGTPKDGKEAEFFKWAREKHLKELDKLPPGEKKKQLEAEKSLADRMNS